tara:strand:+ start:598 stop:969 length:372 start_codon:yes stop_codon:yes gene_type:complete
MAGLGDYIKGKKFTLKSGNNPAFKMIGNPEAGDSPITNEFGIGKGTSPYANVEDTGSGGKGNKVLGNIAQMFMAGINNVYGNPNEKTKQSDSLKKSDEELAQEKANKATLNEAQKIIAANKKP